MEIDFMKELRKRDKLNKLFDFCRGFVPKSPDILCSELASKYAGFHYDGVYISESENNVIVRIFPGRNNAFDVFLNSKIIDSPPQYESITASIYLNSEVMFLYCESGVIMRTAEGEIVEATGWLDVTTHIPITIPEITQETRKGFEEAYDIFYTDDVPELELPQDPEEELIKAIESGIKKAERDKQKSRFKLITPNDASLDDAEKGNIESESIANNIHFK